MNAFVGPTEVFCCGNTLQVNDYSKYNWTMFVPEEKKRHHDETFAGYLAQAEELGQHRIIGMCGLRSNFVSRFVAKTAEILSDFKVFATNMGAKEQVSHAFDYCAVLP